MSHVRSENCEHFNLNAGVPRLVAIISGSASPMRSIPEADIGWRWSVTGGPLTSPSSLQTCSALLQVVSATEPLWRTMIEAEFGSCVNLGPVMRLLLKHDNGLAASSACMHCKLYAHLVTETRRMKARMCELASRSFPAFLPGNEAQNGLCATLDFMTACSACQGLQRLKQRMCSDDSTKALCGLASSAFARLAEGALGTLANLLCTDNGVASFRRVLDCASNQGETFVEQLSSLHAPVVRTASRAVLAMWDAGGLPALPPLPPVLVADSQTLLTSGGWDLVTYSSKGDPYKCALDTLARLLDLQCDRIRPMQFVLSRRYHHVSALQAGESAS